jgi:hypothetical protein
VKQWDLAIEKQKQIISTYPLSEYADQKHSAEIEKRRNIARTTPEVIKIKSDLEEKFIEATRSEVYKELIEINQIIRRKGILNNID